MWSFDFVLQQEGQCLILMVVLAAELLSAQKPHFVPLFKESSFYANAIPLREEQAGGTQVI